MSGRMSLLRRVEDPETSADPAIRALVADLRAAPTIPGPSDAFRAELRAQLVAVAPRLVTEGVVEPAARPVSHRERSAGRSTAVRRRSYGRPFAVAGATVGLFGVVFAGAVYASGGAQPGDALYGLKRASESVDLALTSGDAARGKVYLQQSQTRLDEVRSLLSHDSAIGSGLSAAGAAPSAHTAQLITDTLASADSELRNGTRLLTTDATQSSTLAPLDELTTWAAGQDDRFTTVADRLPSGAVRDRVLSSQALLEQAQQRGQSLKTPLATSSSASCLASSGTDAFGVLPCPSASVPSVPTGPSISTPALPTTTPTLPGPGSSGTVPTVPGAGTGTGTPAGTTAARTAGPTLPALPTSVPGTSLIPTLPTSPLLPTRGIAITAPGGISAGVGTCTVGAVVPPLTVAVTICPPAHS